MQEETIVKDNDNASFRFSTVLLLVLPLYTCTSNYYEVSK